MLAAHSSNRLLLGCGLCPQTFCMTTCAASAPRVICTAAHLSA